MKQVRILTPVGRLAIAVLAVAGALLSAGWADEPSINDKVLQYAKDHVGEKVGNGECTSLAVEALRFAGAKRFPPVGVDADFVWGKPLDSLKQAKPGDVLQFRNAVFKGRGRLANGNMGHWRYSYPHHTAIVAGSKAKGKVLLILHQNIQLPGQDASEKQTVQEGAITLAELQPGGWVRAYRPVPRTEEDEAAGEP